MIYLDNAATTWPKPAGVIPAAGRAAGVFGANPGRGGYAMAQETDRRLFECRSRAAGFFGLEQPEGLVYTPGCTWAINTVLHGCLRPGDHIVISDMEHNAVTRPLRELEKRGVSVSRAKVTEGDPSATAMSFRNAVRRNTAMIFCTHGSNVSGVMPPVGMLGELCHRLGILFATDAAQAAGTETVTAASTGANFICAPAHKGLYGVMGLGMLAVCGSTVPRPLIQGGTGSHSALREQPGQLPEALESGTPPMPAIFALDEGLRVVESVGRKRILDHEMDIISHIYDELKSMGGVTLYTRRPCVGSHVPVLSFNVSDMGSEEAAERLAEKGICVRAGLHCAVDAHRSLGTERRGTVRVSPSMFTTHRDAEAFLRAAAELAK